jgi:hypothetical protein
MEQVNQLIKTVVQSAQSTTPLTSEQDSEQKLYRVDGKLYTKNELVWKRLSGLYGYPFTSQYGNEPTPEWKLALRDIPVDRISAGLEICTKKDSPKHKTFPPNPIEFIVLCSPKAEEYGLPSEVEALNQAVGISSKKHPAVVYTLRNMVGGSYDLRQADTKKAQAMFGEAWLNTVVYVANGGELPEIPKEIEEEKKQSLSQEEKQERMAKLRQDAGL